MSKRRIKSNIKIENEDSCDMKNGVINKTKILIDILWENYLNKCREDKKDSK